jgi:regulatory protein
VENSSLYQKCLILLSRRDHSQWELKQKLSAKESQPALTNPADLDQVLQRLVEEGYQSDQRFAEAFIRARQNKGFGLVRLKQELKQKGVDEQIITNTLAQIPDTQQNDQILKVWRKKYTAPPETPKHQAQQTQFLLYRGFSHQQIRELFHKLKEMQDNPDS